VFSEADFVKEKDGYGVSRVLLIPLCHFKLTGQWVLTEHLDLVKNARTGAQRGALVLENVHGGKLPPKGIGTLLSL
jgi:hypothetical protein